MAALPNIVLVHGAWADGSCWSDVIERPSSNVVMGTPAWKALPSWYLVAENDEVIPPDAERQFAQRMGADTIESRADTARCSPTRRRRTSGS